MLADQTGGSSMTQPAISDAAEAAKPPDLIPTLGPFHLTMIGVGGIIGAPILSVYPGLDLDMLPLALVVVILGGSGSLLGSFVGSIIIGFIYNFGQALLPQLSYFVLFLPMLIVLLLRPQGLFGKFVP